MNLTIKKGTDVSVKITLTDTDITGYSFYFTAKKLLSDADSDALITKDWTTHTDPTNGITHLVLTDEETEIVADSYFYDLVIKTQAGAKLGTIVGKLIITDRVRHTI